MLIKFVVGFTSILTKLMRTSNIFDISEWVWVVKHSFSISFSGPSYRYGSAKIILCFRSPYIYHSLISDDCNPGDYDLVSTHLRIIIIFFLLCQCAFELFCIVWRHILYLSRLWTPTIAFHAARNELETFDYDKQTVHKPICRFSVLRFDESDITEKIYLIFNFYLKSKLRMHMHPLKIAQLKHLFILNTLDAQMLNCICWCFNSINNFT